MSKPPIRAAFRWTPAGPGGGSFAHSGRRIIGAAVQPQGGTRWHWYINDVAGSRHEPATRGESATEAGAKRALRRAWLRWLGDRGLQETPQEPSR